MWPILYEPRHEIPKNVEYSTTVKLLAEHHLKFLSLKGAAQACLSLYLSKCHIVGNHMSRLNFYYYYHVEREEGLFLCIIELFGYCKGGTS